jgi:hypothetical protein
MSGDSFVGAKTDRVCASIGELHALNRDFCAVESPILADDAVCYTTDLRGASIKGSGIRVLLKSLLDPSVL